MTFIRHGDGTFVCSLHSHSSPFVLTITKRSEKVFMNVVKKQKGGERGIKYADMSRQSSLDRNVKTKNLIWK